MGYRRVAVSGFPPLENKINTSPEKLIEITKNIEAVSNPVGGNIRSVYTLL